jgi:Subtilase family
VLSNTLVCAGRNYLFLLLMAALAGGAQADTTLNFEGFPDSTILTTQYSGLTFTNAIILTSGISLDEFEFPPHSGVNVVSDNNGPMTIDFSSPITTFSGYFTYLEPLSLDAFNASSSLIASASSEFSNNEALSGDLGSSPSEFIKLGFAAGISSITITGDPLGSSFTMDDITYTSGTSTIPEPRALPVVFVGMIIIFLRSWLVRFASRRRQPATSLEASLLFAEAFRHRVTARLKGVRAVTLNHAVPLFCLCCVMLLGISNSAWGAAPVGAPSVSPAALNTGTATLVFVTESLRDPSLIPASVEVQQISASGQVLAILGLLNDAGENGDLVAGDHVYSGNVVINAPATEGTVYIRVSYALLGSLRRSVSPVVALNVVPSGVPTAFAPPDVSQVATDVNTGLQIISNEVVACFSNAATSSQIQAIVSTVGGTLIGSLAFLGKCYQIQLPTSSAAGVASAITTLLAEPMVVSADPDNILSLEGPACTGLPTCGSLSYNSLNLSFAQTINTGADEIVAVLDTGRDKNNTILASHVLGGFDETGSGTVQDTNGHGTWVTSILAAVAPSARILPIKTSNGFGTYTQFAAGIGDAIASGAIIINISSGGFGHPAYFANAIAEATSRDIVVVAAAGNEGVDTKEYPAAFTGVISVGAVNSSDVRLSAADGCLKSAGSPPVYEASNFGNWVSIAAPGFQTPGSGIPTFGLNNTTDYVCGTSFAAPFVAGTAALIESTYPDLTSSQILTQLQSTALPIPFIAGKDTCPSQPCNQDLGSGRLDPVAALGTIRFTRSTAIGFGEPQTVDVTVDNGSATLYSGSISTSGQSTGCEVVTVSNPPCIVDIPFNFGALASGTYTLTIHLPPSTSDVFFTLLSTVPGPSDLIFTGVISGSGTISSPTTASGALFGFSINTIRFGLTKN